MEVGVGFGVGVGIRFMVEILVEVGIEFKVGLVGVGVRSNEYTNYLKLIFIQWFSIKYIYSEWKI